MKTFIKNLSIKWKLMLAIMLTSSVAIIGATTVFVINEEASYRKFIVEDVLVLGDMMEGNVSTAVAFEDEKFAKEVLSELRAKPDIRIAAVYDNDGTLFSYYAQNKFTPPSALPSPLIATQTKHFFSDGRLEFSTPIKQMDEQIGVLYISTSLDTMYQRLAEFIYIVLIVLVISLLVTLALSFLLQRLISKPILSLAEVAQDISRDSNYSIRADKQTGDEVGALIDNFNAMVEKIQERDLRLEEARDILEIQVRERTQRLQIILDTAADGIITFDNLGAITSVNRTAESMFGFDVDEAIGVNINTLMPHAFLSDAIPHTAEEQASVLPYSPGIWRELKGHRHDKSLFPCELAIGEADIKNEVIYTAIVRDITERKKIDRLKTEFISTVSHELRTPLTSIRGSLQLINGGAVGEMPEQAGNLIDIACNNTERLLLLINDILDFEKIQSGNMRLAHEPIEISPFVTQALEEHAGYAKQHRVQYILKAHIDNAFVFADPHRLMQVLANLLSNAAKFSPEGGEINISVCRQEEHRIRILVQDSGPGIQEAFRQKIFDRFTQSDASDTRQKGGTGLGLAIAKGIMEQHNGTIDFVSPPGEGTTFYIELPEYDHATQTNGQ